MDLKFLLKNNGKTNMTRGIDASAVTESQKSLNALVTLIDVLVDPSDPVYLSDYSRDLIVDGKEYVGAGNLVGLSAVVEDSSNAINKVDFVFGGVDDEIIKLILDYDYIDRPITIRKQFVNPNSDALVGGSFLVFDGRIDQPVITHAFDSRTATISIACSNHWVDYARKNNRHTNDAEQQAIFSGDSCFRYSIDFDKEVKWGQTS